MIGGALRSPDSLDDYIYENASHGKDNVYLAAMPETYDLRRFMQPSRSQGDRSTCGAHAAAYIKEIQEAIDCNFSETMSPEFIYYHRENRPAAGMYGRNIFQILQQIGSVPESAYPHTGDDAPKPGERHYAIAAKYRIRHFARVTTLNGLKRALLEVGPCYLQLPLFAARPYFWRQTGSETPISGHAVAVVGYTREGFILKNSWGPRWNGDGCIVFPYDEWGLVWECWVAVDEKTTDEDPDVTTPAQHTATFMCVLV